MLIGIFVGGRGRRMGGVAKGNLIYRGRPILERTLEACRDATERLGRDAASVTLCLVGASSAYSASALVRIEDDPAGVGPMGGLRALLLEAERQGVAAIALANDLPFLDAGLLARLISEVPSAAALAPRSDGRWEPLFARYAPAAVLPVIDVALGRSLSSLQVLFDTLGSAAAELALSGDERGTLHDWDRPSDMISRCPKSAR
jgi:molybdopterin-guanine dinucleotide biosynthesis protein A